MRLVYVPVFLGVSGNEFFEKILTSHQKSAVTRVVIVLLSMILIRAHLTDSQVLHRFQCFRASLLQRRSLIRVEYLRMIALLLTFDN